jgi:hypothetical protein
MTSSPVKVPPDKAAQAFGRMADDYFVATILHKTFYKISSTLPFLHAHALELSAKAACHELGLSLTVLKNGHDLMGIYKILETEIPEIIDLIPTSAELNDYKNVWLRDDGTPQNITLPPPNELVRLELAYFVDNVMNLKYGFTKGLVAVSMLQISYSEINSSFLSLYRCCRAAYANIELNIRIKAELCRIFGDTPDTHQRIHTLLEI